LNALYAVLLHHSLATLQNLRFRLFGLPNRQLPRTLCGICPKLLENVLIKKCFTFIIVFTGEMDMDKGNIIFLNGVTSSGKTSISRTIQEIDKNYFYYLSDDTFYHFYWDMFHDKYDEQIIKYGLVDRYEAEAKVFMYQFAKMISMQGVNVIIDSVLMETNGFTDKYKRSNYDILQDTLSEIKLLMVEVYCPLEECKRRNIVREDRRENQSYEQHEIMNKNINYDFFIDTSINSTNECAQKILKKFYERR
jgi:adenylylsulfate kinase/chloramphenicol 3-O phosphotransferase